MTVGASTVTVACDAPGDMWCVVGRVYCGMRFICVADPMYVDEVQWMNRSVEWTGSRTPAEAQMLSQIRPDMLSQYRFGGPHSLSFQASVCLCVPSQARAFLIALSCGFRSFPEGPTFPPPAFFQN